MILRNFMKKEEGKLSYIMIIKQKWKGVRKKTSIGRRWIKTSSMNKRKRASFKKYRGQG